MRLLERFRSGDTATAPPLPEPTVDEAQLLLRSLGENGFGLRDPETELPIRADDPALADMGAFVVVLEDIAERRDTSRCLASAPGRELTLVPDGGDVVVHDADGRYDIGMVPSDVAPALAEALRSGASYRAISIWELKALDGSRTELRVLIVPDAVELILAVDSPDLIVLGEDDVTA